MIPTPILPLYHVVLVAALPAVWLAGRSLARRVAGDALLAAWMAPAFSLALWLPAVQAAGLISGTFVGALWGGTFAVAALGLAGLFGDRRAPPLPPPADASSSRQRLVACVVAILAVAAPALRGNFHDEILVTGHMSIVHALQNGPFPPHHLTFPDLELRYHYGFDLVAAAVTALFRLPTESAIDAVTVPAFGYAAGLLCLIGERVVGRGKGWISCAVVGLGGGLPFFSDAKSWVDRASGWGRIEGTWLAPGFVSWFFQHPFSIAFPLGFVAILLLLDRRPASLPWRYLGLGVLFVALSQSQVVAFVSLLAAGTVVESLNGRRLAPRRAFGMLGVAAVALLWARFSHGLLSPPQEPVARWITFAPFTVVRTPSGLLLWHALSFGLILPLGAVGLFRLREGRLLFGLLFVGGLGTVNAFRYTHTWDIVTFCAVAEVALSVGASAVVAALLAMPAHHRVLGWLLMAGSTVWGISFLGVTGLVPEDLPLVRVTALPPADVEAIDWLRRHVAPGEGVYRRRVLALDWAIWSGLPQMYPDRAARGFPWGSGRLEKRDQLCNERPRDPQRYLEQRIRWFVVEPRDLLRIAADDWLANGQAVEAAKFGDLQIVRLK